MKTDPTPGSSSESDPTLADRHVTRSIVRGIVVSDLGETLLMKMSFPWFDEPVWIAPGGGLAQGEAAVDGLRRELREETGRALQIGPQVWERSFVVEHEGRVVHAHERYFTVRTERFTPETHGLEEHERAWFRGFRWWTSDDLLQSGEPTSPQSLPGLLARIAAELGR